MEVYLIRHTAVDVEKTICYGSSDVPLKGTFPEEAAAVRGKLPPNREEYRIVSSPLTRCRRLAEELGGNVIADERLVEFSFGNWEMQQWSDISREEISAWFKAIDSTPVPGGDRLDHFQERIVDFWDELMTRGHEKVFVVSHTAAIHALLAWLLHIPLKHLFSFNIDYGGISLVGKERGSYMIQYINR